MQAIEHVTPGRGKQSGSSSSGVQGDDDLKEVDHDASTGLKKQVADPTESVKDSQRSAKDKAINMDSREKKARKLLR